MNRTTQYGGLAIAPHSLNAAILPSDPERIERFEAYANQFRAVFQRSDQFLRFQAYSRGLLEPTERKNVEAIALAASEVMTVQADLAQALQHFVSQSPWDARRLMATLREQTRPLRHDPDALLVVHEGVFPKKGKHSVGVQRQFARAVGRKINCQLAIFISQIGPRGFFPLAVRLYLPSHWLRENPELAEKMIPEEERYPASKTEIALGLLEEVLQERDSLSTVTAEAGYLSAPDFIDVLASRHLSIVDDHQFGVIDAQKWLEWLNSHLGLDHFEGRTWHGWHHHISLVFATYYFLASEGRVTQEQSVLV